MLRIYSMFADVTPVVVELDHAEPEISACSAHGGLVAGERFASAPDYTCYWDISTVSRTSPLNQIGPRTLFLSDRTTARLSVDFDTKSFDAMSRTDRLLRANDLLAEVT